MPEQQLTYLWSQLDDAVELALGGAPDIRTTAADIVHQALERLVTAHAWTWRNTTADLDEVDAEYAIALPQDFGRLIGIAPNAETRKLRQTTLSDLLRRRNAGRDDGCRYYTLTGAVRLATTAPAQRQIVIYPTPADDLADALTIAYRRLLPIRETDDDCPDIPAGLHGLLYRMCRHQAHLQQDPDSAEASAEAAAVAAALRDAIEEDIEADAGEGMMLTDQLTELEES